MMRPLTLCLGALVAAANPAAAQTAAQSSAVDASRAQAENPAPSDSAVADARAIVALLHPASTVQRGIAAAGEMFGHRLIATYANMPAYSGLLNAIDTRLPGGRAAASSRLSQAYQSRFSAHLSEFYAHDEGLLLQTLTPAELATIRQWLETATGPKLVHAYSVIVSSNLEMSSRFGAQAGDAAEDEVMGAIAASLSVSLPVPAQTSAQPPVATPAPATAPAHSQ